MKVLLTGYTGYLGAHIGRLLVANGFDVKALCRKQPSESVKGMEFIAGDFTVLADIKRAAKNCDAVIHSGGFVSLWHYNPSIFYDVNVKGTENILEACHENGVQRFVFVSSASVFGATPSSPVNEEYNFSVEKNSHYAKSKVLAESKVLAAAKNGVHVNVVYPSRIYGPGPAGHSNSITWMIDQYRKGKWRFVPPYGDRIGSYGYVEDIAEAIIATMTKGKPGERYLLTGDNVSYDTFFENLRFLTGERQSVYRIPYPALKAMAVVQESLANITKAFTPKIVNEQVDKFRHHYAFDNAKAIQEVGFKIRPVSKGIYDTLEWLKQQKN